MTRWRLCVSHNVAELGSARGLTSAYRCDHAALFGLFDCEWVDAEVSTDAY